jgi:hypothetical protein
VLIGNVGPAMYHAFFAATAGLSDQSDPLDHWTRGIIEPIAARFAARAVFPFGGPPWFPFQRWAIRAEGLKASPLGILIHPEFGLWHAYRAALLFDHALDLKESARMEHPCDSCAGRPCLNNCPADAVSLRRYDVERCATHVVSAAGTDCRESGCLARRACPVGSDHVYPPAAMSFHMAAFLRGRRAGELPAPRRVNDS